MRIRPHTSERLTERMRQPEIAAVIPPAEHRETLLETTVSELKRKYPKRYEIYVQYLRQSDRLSPEQREDIEQWVRVMNNVDEYAFFSRENELNILRDTQKVVFDALREHMEQGKRTGYVRLPTGVGKTVLFIELAEVMNVRTIVLTSRQILVEQIAREFGRFAEGVDVGVYYTKKKEIGKQVTVTTYDSFVQQVERGIIDPNTFGLVVLDEAHRGLSEARQKAIKFCTKPFLFGFSATPSYREEKSLEAILGERIYNMEVREAIEQGLLCGVSVMLGKTGVDLSAVERDAMGEYSEEELARALMVAPGLTDACADLYQKQFSGQKALVFCVNVDHAKSVAEGFRKKGVQAAAVWSAMSPKERESVLSRARSGEIDVLTNVDILTEGFDNPRLSVCLNLAPTSSLVRAEQRAGRVLRLDPQASEKRATIVEFLYSDTRNNRSILFSHILEGAYVLPRAQWSQERDSKVKDDTEEARPSVVLAGIEIVVDTEEIMRITNGSSIATEENVSVSRIAWEEFVQSVQKAAQQAESRGAPIGDIQKWYNREQKKHRDWPSRPTVYFSEYWDHWPALLGREKKVSKLAWDVFVLEVREALRQEEIKTNQSVVSTVEFYRRLQKGHPRWPADPYSTYPKEFKGFPALFGREFVEKLSWDSFIFAVRKVAEAQQKQGKKIGDIQAWYREESKKHPDWPAGPPVYYEDRWKTWAAMLGKEKVKKLSWEAFVPAVRAERDAEEQVGRYATSLATFYRSIRSKHPEWPSDPDVFYKDHWQNWMALFQRK